MCQLNKGVVMGCFKKTLYVSLAVFCLLYCGCKKAERGKWSYPSARKDSVVDVYHGVEVADPYRWLEDADSAETVEWVEQQNKLSSGFVNSFGGKKAVRKRLEYLWNYERYSSPWKKGGRYFYRKNDGLQNQSVLYVQASLKGEPAVVINPNLLSEDGTIALSTTAVSEDGKLLAYGLSSSGSDEKEIKVLDIDGGREYEEVLKWCKFTSIAWRHDSAGFFYDRFPEPNSVAPEDRNNYNRVYWHKLGTEQAEDPLVYERPDEKELGFSPMITEDGEFLILVVYHGTDVKNRVYYRAVWSEGDFVRLLDEADARYEFIGNTGGVFYFHTDSGAPRGRIIAIDIGSPNREDWREVVGEGEDVIDYAAFVNNHFVVAYLHDVCHKLKVYDGSGAYVKEIELPGIGRVSGLWGKQDDSEMFFSFSSFLFPSTSYRYDFAADKLTIFREPQIDFDAAGYETKQVFYKSKDGTRVPMFITHKKGLALDGGNPTLLYGYGGFNITIKPSFSISNLVWLEQGGVYAVANLRGGTEYGERWHEEGMLGNKQNVFDDFISAAEWLIANKYTSVKKLAIKGGSNGGLLTSACMLQRPELFGAIVCQVPVTDMLRYHKFTVGRYWVPEYGNAEASVEEFGYLYAYSPLHNVKEGVEYPPIFVTSADTDDRVVPSHAKKLVATLQEKAGGGNPILLRVETKAGHGGGKPTSKVIEEVTDVYSFLFKILNISYQNR